MIIHMEQPEQTNPKSGIAPIRVCALDDLPIGLGRAFEIQGRVVAFFRTRAGGVFAVNNACPHKNGPLVDGMLAGNSVVCPLHAFRFDMTTGECDQPGTCSVRAYAVEVRGTEVYIHMAEAAA